MKICCIVTTYKNRYKFLNKVLMRLIDEKIRKIIIVNNNSHIETKVKIEQLAKLFSSLKIINFSRNQGSAKGIKRGLQIAKNLKNVDFIWILDDDNLPKKNSVKILLKNFSYLNGKYKKVLTPIRYKLPQYKKYLNGQHDFNFSENNFIKFNFFKNISKLFFRKKFKVKKFKKIQMAPYGGLFFHKSLLDNVGFPNVKFNTYGDDYEFTFRMIKNNYKIYLCKNYFVEDIDKTFGHNNYFNKNTNEKKIYFQIRNHTSISKKFITNILFYRANMYIFILYILMRNVFKIVRPLVFFRRVNIILKAIIDGNKNF